MGLSPKNSNRYFVKWNVSGNDAVSIPAEKLEAILGENPPKGMWLQCTIEGLGPGHVAWNKQHPFTFSVESRETRAAYQPAKGRMTQGSKHWKKSHRSGGLRTDYTISPKTLPAYMREGCGPQKDMSKSPSVEPRDSFPIPAEGKSRSLAQLCRSKPQSRGNS